MKWALYAVITLALFLLPFSQLPLNLRPVSALGIVRVQNEVFTTATNLSGDASITLTSAPADGDAQFIAISGTGNADPSSIVQTGASWSKVDSSSEFSLTEGLWYSLNVASAGTGIAIHSVAGNANLAIVYVEYSGIAASSALDKSAKNNGNTATADSGTTLTTTQTNELWFAALGNGGESQSSPTNSFVIVNQQLWTYDSAALEKIVSATGTANTGTTLLPAIAWAGVIATFKAAPLNAKLSDSMNLIDVLVTNRPILTGTLNIIDSLKQSYGGNRGESDALSFTDLIKLRNSKPISDVMTWQDTIVRHYARSTTLQELLTLVDSSNMVWTSAGASHYYANLADMFSFIDSISRIGPPRAPTAVAATANPVTPQAAIDVTWTDSYGDYTNFYVEHSTDGLIWTQIGTTAGTSFTDSALSVSTSYQYRIRAYNGQYGGYSNSVTGITTAGPDVSGGGGNNNPVSFFLVVKVQDLNGNPLVGASVSQGSQSLLTDASGLANFGNIQSGSYLITAQAATCTGNNVTISLNSNHPSDNPVQLSLACGSQQSGGNVTLAQSEQLITVIIALALLGMGMVFIIKQQQSKKRKQRGQ